MAGAGRENLLKAAARFVIQRVEDERGFTRTGDAGDNRQTISKRGIYVFEIVLGSALNLDMQA